MRVCDSSFTWAQVKYLTLKTDNECCFVGDGSLVSLTNRRKTCLSLNVWATVDKDGWFLHAKRVLHTALVGALPLEVNGPLTNHLTTSSNLPPQEREREIHFVRTDWEIIKLFTHPLLLKSQKNRNWQALIVRRRVPRIGTERHSSTSE